jgi:gas vesicle protein
MQTYNTPLSDGPQTAGSRSSTDQAKEKAREQAQHAAHQAKDTLRTQVDQRSTEAADKVHGVASDVRSVGEQLREQGKDQPARLADQAADRAERLGDYLRQSDADRILRDVEDFGRRRPWAVIAGGVALGIVASRFLKASSRNRYEQDRAEHNPQLPAHTYGTSTPVTPPSYPASSYVRSG